MNKVEKGTPNFTESLCTNCRHAQIIRGQRFDDAVTICHETYAPGGGHREITFPVTFCTRYDDTRVPELFEMKRLAWRICSDKKKGTAGFMSPAEWKASNTDGSDEDPF